MGVRKCLVDRCCLLNDKSSKEQKNLMRLNTWQLFHPPALPALQPLALGYLVRRTATSWWAGLRSLLGLMLFCHLQKLDSVFSAWWTIFNPCWRKKRKRLAWVIFLVGAHHFSLQKQRGEMSPGWVSQTSGKNSGRPMYSSGPTPCSKHYHSHDFH